MYTLGFDKWTRQDFDSAANPSFFFYFRRLLLYRLAPCRTDRALVSSRLISSAFSFFWMAAFGTLVTCVLPPAPDAPRGLV